MPLSQSIARVIRAMSVIATLILLYTLTVRPQSVPEHSPSCQPQRTLDEPPERYRGDCDYQPVRVVAVSHVIYTDGQCLYVAEYIRACEHVEAIAAKTIWFTILAVDQNAAPGVLSRDTSNGFPDTARRSRMVSVVDVRDGRGFRADSAPVLLIDSVTHGGNAVFSRVCGLTQSVRFVKNARHTPVRAFELSRVVLTNSRLCDQGTDTVLTPYIGRSLPLQSYLRFSPRAPPLMADRDSPNTRQTSLCAPFTPRTKKPQKGLQSLLRLFEV